MRRGVDPGSCLDGSALRTTPGHTRRAVLGLVGAAGLAALAGCTEGESGGGTTPTPTGSADGNSGGGDDGPGTGGSGGSGGSDDSGGTSLAGSCASAFGDTMERYDPGDRGMVATFSYPSGGEVINEQDDSAGYGTIVGYGQGELSPLHSVTVFDNGQTNQSPDVTEARDIRDGEEAGTVTTPDGQERPVIIRRTGGPAVTYLFHAEWPDGVYQYDVTTAAGEAEGCPEVYESVTRRIVESFTPV